MKIDGEKEEVVKEMGRGMKKKECKGRWKRLQRDEGKRKEDEKEKERGG